MDHSIRLRRPEWRVDIVFDCGRAFTCEAEGKTPEDAVYSSLRAVPQPHGLVASWHATPLDNPVK